MSAQPKTKLSSQEYLELEIRAEVRSEYFDGEVFAMAGTSLNHTRIVRNISRRLDEHTESGPCEVVSNDLRVSVPFNNAYVYPDLVGLCQEPKLDSSKFNTLLNPELIIEVLSSSTEAYDRGLKFAGYRTIPTVKEYIIIAQDEMRVEQYLRQADDTWQVRFLEKADDLLQVESMKCAIPLSQIYDRVNFGEVILGD